MIVLANDGISQVGVEKLENNGFKVITTNVAQDQIIDYINRNSITSPSLTTYSFPSLLSNPLVFAFAIEPALIKF